MVIKKADASGLVTKTVPNTEIEEVNNKIPHLSGLVKLTNYDTKIFLIEGKYFTSSDYNKFTSNIFNAKIKQKKLVKKSHISNLIKFFDFNTKLASWAAKAELKAEQEKIVKLETFDSIHFCGKSHFEDDDVQNY